MKAKACTRCRQAKLRCDSDVKSPGPCSRCESISQPCTFDRAFQHTSKSRRLRELEAEVQRLQRAATTNNGAPTRPTPTDAIRQQQVPQATQLCLLSKSLGNVHLAAAQVSELFRVFFTQNHPYLPFSLQTSPDIVYEKCPLLFWVICAVSSSPSTMLELQPHIQAMVGQMLVNPPRLVEVVQALLILCMWPFPFFSSLSDPSFLYCGLATQISLQIGLHKPSLSQEFSSRLQVLDVREDVRLSTWMACYVVNQMQTGRLGVPLSIQADYTLLRALEAQQCSPTLTALCRISRLTVQFTTVIGASAQTPSGLMDPVTRIEMVRFFSSELDSLQLTHSSDMHAAIEISYLTSRLHLWSFILQADIPRCPDVVEFFGKAEKDAINLIQLASERNLSRCPFHLTRSVLYSAVTLTKIMASPYASHAQVILDQIHLASRTLSSAVRVDNDHAQRWSKHLVNLVTLQDEKKTPPIRSRMAASLVYDAIRIIKEHSEIVSSDYLHAAKEHAAAPDWEDLATGPLFDLNGIDWDDLGGLL